MIRSRDFIAGLGSAAARAQPDQVLSCQVGQQVPKSGSMLLLDFTYRRGL